MCRKYKEIKMRRGIELKICEKLNCKHLIWKKGFMSTFPYRCKFLESDCIDDDIPLYHNGCPVPKNCIHKALHVLEDKQCRCSWGYDIEKCPEIIKLKKLNLV